MTDAEEVERAAEAAWLKDYGAATGDRASDWKRGHLDGFTAGVAWAREQPAAKPANSGEVAELRAEVARLKAERDDLRERLHVADDEIRELEVK